ncbi:aminotransferase class V-fold PLP-dependent enzyme [candidate division KSB1 bacterium]|nr:aminotransferase class V-fold PLP-dependent enzyme [candidate division KSB1 bacterium]
MPEFRNIRKRNAIFRGTGVSEQNSIRDDFTLIKKGYTYFDNAATSLTPVSVIQRISDYYNCHNGNVSRGAHQLTRNASLYYQDARQKTARFIDAKEDEIIFCRNATEAINLLAQGIDWKAGDNIVTTLVEHHSNYVPWLRVRDRHQVELRIAQPNREGVFDLGDFKKAISDRTKLVTTGQVSNVLGTVNPVREIADLAHNKGAWLLVDAAQSLPHLPIDVDDLGCDFLAGSGHKMLGPTGIGFLFIKKELQYSIQPLAIGGGTIHDVARDRYDLLNSIERFEGGTPHIAGALGLAAAIDYIEKIGWDFICKKDTQLVANLEEGLKKRDYVTIYGPVENSKRVSLVSFNIENCRPHRVASLLDEMGKIMVRSGHHCALPLTKYVLNATAGTVRASLYFYNLSDEIEHFFDIIDFIHTNS